MNPLQVLKESLQKSLNESTESEDYKLAIEDGVYATKLSVAGLETWLSTWNGSQDVDYLYSGEFSKEYQQGVAFVEEQWHQITGMF